MYPRLKKVWIEIIAIGQPASVKIQEMWHMGRNGIIYPPA